MTALLPGATIINACRILKDFEPKAISVLTLFSEKAGKMTPNTDHMSWKTVLKMNESENTDIIGVIPDNEIWYLSTDGLVVEPGTIGCPDDYQMVSNEYSGFGIIKFEKPITTIWMTAFKNCENLKVIMLPKTIKYINKEAFCRCVNLVKVYGSGNIINFGLSSFYGSGIKEISINSHAIISNFTFGECKNLQTIYLLGLSQHIETFSFDGCDNINAICRNTR